MKRICIVFVNDESLLIFKIKLEIISWLQILGNILIVMNWHHGPGHLIKELISSGRNSEDFFFLESVLRSCGSHRYSSFAEQCMWVTLASECICLTIQIFWCVCDSFNELYIHEIVRYYN